MLADDSKVVRVKTGRLLAQHGYRVVVAESGEEAVAKLDDELPHVLITDVEMPGIDGFELTRRVRADQRTAHIPVVMITSSHDRLQDAARRAGVTLLLGKPYAEQALLDGLRLAQEPAEAAAAT
jgi:CheY-like chemotaxis protein